MFGYLYFLMGFHFIHCKVLAGKRAQGYQEQRIVSNVQQIDLIIINTLLRVINLSEPSHRCVITAIC